MSPSTNGELVSSPVLEPVVCEPVVYEDDIGILDVPERLHLKAAACHWLSEHGYTDNKLALKARYALIDEARDKNLYGFAF